MEGTSIEPAIPLQTHAPERDPDEEELTQDEEELIQAAKRGNWGDIEKLLTKGTNVNCEDKFQMRPIHYAAAYGRTEIFEKLTMNEGIMLMPSLWNCLDLAIDNEHEETVIKMLSIDTVDWKNMMISRSWIDQQSKIGFIDTPFRKLIRNMPEVARLVLNKHTTIGGSKEFCEVLFDFTLMDVESRMDMPCPRQYTFIASENAGAGLVRCAICNNQMQYIRHDTTGSPSCPESCSNLKEVMDQGQQYTSISSGKTPIKENHPLVIMVKCKRKELLYHPLVSAYLKRTWKPSGIIAISAYFTLYAVFLALLTGFTLSLEAPYQLNRNSSSNTSNCSETVDHIPAFASKAKYALHVLIAMEFILEITVVCIMFWRVGWRYSAGLKRVCDIATYISAFVFVIDINECHDTGFRKEFQWTFGTISIFLAWMNLLGTCRRFEGFGVYVVMLFRLVKIFTKFLLIFSLLIVPFTISFHCLFQNQDQFSTFGRSLVKTTSMMIGEIDFTTTLYDEYVNFEFLSFVFFSIFMLLMPIVVVNLLVGLAVEDIHACKRNASLEKRRLQVDLMLEFSLASDSKYSWSPFSIPVPKITKLVIPKNQGFIKKMWNRAWKLTEHDIRSGLKPEKDRIFKLERKLNKLRNYMKKQMETTNEILERLKKKRRTTKLNILNIFFKRHKM